MPLTESDVKKVAHLARLALDDAEIPVHAKNLSNILDLIEQMNQTNTSGISPLAHPLDINQPLRCDEVTETDQRSLNQSIAPQVEAGLYIVPQVIE